MKEPIAKASSNIINYLIAFLMMALMLITTVDVIGRYLFQHPLPGSTELTEFCLGLLIFATLPLVCRSNLHITVDLFENVINQRLKKIREVAIQLFLVTGLIAFSYGVYILAGRAERDQLVSEILNLPIDFFYYLYFSLILVSIFAVILYLFNKKNNFTITNSI